MGTFGKPILRRQYKDIEKELSHATLAQRGMHIVEDLRRSAISPAAEAARDLAPIFLTFMNRLADESFLAPQRFKEIAVERLGEANGTFVSDEFLKHAQRSRFISFSNSAVTLTSAHYGHRLYDLLQNSLDSLTPPIMFVQMKRLAKTAAICLRATTALREQWKVALSIHGMRNVHAWCRDDATADQLPAPKGDYHIVWENPGIMSIDLEDAGLRPFLGRAIGRHCYVAPGMELPDNIGRIELDANDADQVTA